MTDFNSELVSTINYMRQCELISEEKKTVMINLLSGVTMFFPDSCMKEFADVVKLCGTECMLVPTAQNIDFLLAKSQTCQSMFFQILDVKTIKAQATNQQLVYFFGQFRKLLLLTKQITPEVAQKAELETLAMSDNVKNAMTTLATVITQSERKEKEHQDMWEGYIPLQQPGMTMLSQLTGLLGKSSIPTAENFQGIDMADLQKQALGFLTGENKTQYLTPQLGEIFADSSKLFKEGSVSRLPEGEQQKNHVMYEGINTELVSLAEGFAIKFNGKKKYHQYYVGLIRDLQYIISKDPIELYNLWKEDLEKTKIGTCMDTYNEANVSEFVTLAPKTKLFGRFRIHEYRKLLGADSLRAIWKKWQDIMLLTSMTSVIPVKLMSKVQDIALTLGNGGAIKETDMVGSILSAYQGMMSNEETRDEIASFMESINSVNNCVDTTAQTNAPTFLTNLANAANYNA